LHPKFHIRSLADLERCLEKGGLLAALANPHVDIVGHPTSRLIDTREPLEMDFERVLAPLSGAARLLK